MVRKPKKGGIDLFIDVPNVLVAISPPNLQQVLLNLLLTARQALPAVGFCRPVKLPAIDRIVAQRAFTRLIEVLQPACLIC